MIENLQNWLPPHFPTFLFVPAPSTHCPLAISAFRIFALAPLLEILFFCETGETDMLLIQVSPCSAPSYYSDLSLNVTNPEKPSLATQFTTLYCIMPF